MIDSERGKPIVLPPIIGEEFTAEESFMIENGGKGRNDRTSHRDCAPIESLFDDRNNSDEMHDRLRRFNFIPRLFLF